MFETGLKVADPRTLHVKGGKIDLRLAVCARALRKTVLIQEMTSVRCAAYEGAARVRRWCRELAPGKSQRMEREMAESLARSADRAGLRLMDEPRHSCLRVAPAGLTMGEYFRGCAEAGRAGPSSTATSASPRLVPGPDPARPGCLPAVKPAEPAGTRWASSRRHHLDLWSLDHLMVAIHVPCGTT